MHFAQDPYDIRCEWGRHGAETVAADTAACVIVDVLSFSSCVSIAVDRGAVVYPCPMHDDAPAVAAALGAELAARRGEGQYTLSPETLQNIPSGTHLILPSPNGATLSTIAASDRVFAGCLRNAGAVAAALARAAAQVTIVPAGERWPDGTLRPAAEDLIGAGAIIHTLRGSKSPEAALAEAAFLSARDDLPGALAACGSGRELIARGYGSDVTLAAQLNADASVPIRIDGGYRALA